MQLFGAKLLQAAMQYLANFLTLDSLFDVLRYEQLYESFVERDALRSWDRRGSLGSLVGNRHGTHKKSGSRIRLPGKIGSGGQIRTGDLWVMSPTSYQAAPPRNAPENITGGSSRRKMARVAHSSSACSSMVDRRLMRTLVIRCPSTSRTVIRRAPT